jgi:hypothetical protein
MLHYFPMCKLPNGNAAFMGGGAADGVVESPENLIIETNF